MVLTPSAKKLKNGDRAPEFSLMNVDGKTVSLSNFKDHPVVVIFMCNHCPYVKAKIEEIADIQDNYRKQGVVVIGINSNDPTDYPEDGFDNMKLFAEEWGLKYYLVDPTQEVARAYGASCTPDPFVFNSAHRLVYHGRINDAMEPGQKPKHHDIKHVLGHILEHSEDKIEKWFVPSIGCSIKWKGSSEQT